ncbi:MAG: ATP synthase F0 subunit C [Acidobacteria bacterium]|nr:ATP synthase F0 subunit C [Acidobacteriota bacterium]
MSPRLTLLLLVLFAMASPMMAADGGITIPNSLAMGIASGLCALGQGKAIAGAAEGMARNPGAEGAIRFALILGLVLIESLALYTLVVIFAKA